MFTFEFTNTNKTEEIKPEKMKKNYLPLIFLKTQNTVFMKHITSLSWAQTKVTNTFSSTLPSMIWAYIFFYSILERYFCCIINVLQCSWGCIMLWCFIQTLAPINTLLVHIARLRTISTLDTKCSKKKIHNNWLLLTKYSTNKQYFSPSFILFWPWGGKGGGKE